MVTHQIHVGMCAHRTFAPSFVTELARELDERGGDQLWVIEDCFYTAGVSLAAAALTATERLTVGIGILPAVARNPAVTAMEIATLDGLGPGRLLPGIGHGVQSWMGQMGVRPVSPLTTLGEVMVAVGRLLAGEEVTTRGHVVNLDGVRLDQPPAAPPPLLAGVRGPKSLALAGQVAGGVVLAEPASPSYVRWALDHAARQPDEFHVAAFGVLRVMPERRDAYRAAAPWLATLLSEPSAGLTTLPFYDDMVARYTADGLDGLVTMPTEWWTELAPVGTLDDAVAHVRAMEAAGVRSLGLFPATDPAVARDQVSDVVALARQ